MRVTANTFANGLVDQLNRLAIRQNRLQNQAATGQRVTLPEDDPTAMRRVLDLQTEARSVSQYQGNIDRHKELAGASYSGMSALKKISDRASEIATLADGLSSPEELAAYAAELNEMIKEGVQVANTKNRGDYIFAGTRTDQPPFTTSTDANGHVTAVVYEGNTDLAESEISSGVTLTGQALGANTTGSGPRGLLADSRTGADFFNHLISLRDNLVSGNTSAINSTDLSQIAADQDNFILHFSANGSIQSRLEATSAIGKSRKDTIESLVSKEADADLSETLVRLNQTQTAYQAALQSGGKMLGQSLLDYLH